MNFLINLMFITATDSGNGSKVLMIVHVSPCKDDIGETVCSLNFARRVRAVESNREHFNSEASLGFFAVLIRLSHSYFFNLCSCLC